MNDRQALSMRPGADTPIGDDVIQLCSKEIALAALIESHSLACHALHDLVLNAIKQKDDDSWKKNVCAPFSASLRPHVAKCLENNSPIADIYVLLTILRCRINVIKLTGENPVDRYGKELFCLRVLGVETARHWACKSVLVSAESSSLVWHICSLFSKSLVSKCIQ